MFPFNSQQNRRVDLTFPITIGCLVTALSLPAQAQPPTGSAGNTRRQAPQPVVIGDLNGDRVVNSVDRDLFMNAWAAAVGGAPPGQADLNGDGVITLADLNILEAAAGLPLTAPPANTPTAGGSFDWRADLSGNGVVDFADLELFLVAWSASYSGGDPGQADINMDGLLNFNDLAILISLFGASVSPPTTDVTLLQPGDGFSVPTPQPAAVGVAGSPGYDAKAIARWDVVPYQEISGEFEVGVVAFHRKGIDRVEFSLEGGPWLAAHEMTENERTGVWEYWTTVNANEMPDGPLEIRAVAYPNVGEPRVLEPLFLNANAHGTWGRGEVWVSSASGSDTSGNGTEASPFKTIWKAMQSFGAGANIDGLTVHLKEGEYRFAGSGWPTPVTQDGWVTITAAPGVPNEDVRITGDPSSAGANCIRIGRLRLKNITWDQRTGWSSSSVTAVQPMLWLDEIHAIGPGATTPSNPYHAANWTGVYVTGSSLTSYKDGFCGATLVRDAVVTSIGSDAYSNSKMVINSRVDGIDRGPTAFHPDVYQFHSASQVIENIILYGLRAKNAKAQGIFSRGSSLVRDVALVNCLIHVDSSQSAWQSQWHTPSDHVVFLNSSFVGHNFTWVTADLSNFLIAGTVFQKTFAYPAPGQTLTMAQVAAAVEFRQNHFVDVTSYAAQAVGVEYTTGDPLYLDFDAGDLRPRSNSPLLHRMENCAAASDLTGHARPGWASVGPFEGSD